MSFLKRLFAKRMDEATLNKESACGANHYINQRMKGAPMKELQQANNYLATGFYMGARWYEERMGLNARDKGQR